MTALPEITARREMIADEGTITTTGGGTGIETVPIESGTTMIEVAPAGRGAGVARPVIATCIAVRTTVIEFAPAGQGAGVATPPISTCITLAGQGAGFATPAIATCLADGVPAIQVARMRQGAAVAPHALTPCTVPRTVVVGEARAGHQLKITTVPTTPWKQLEDRLVREDRLGGEDLDYKTMAC